MASTASEGEHVYADVAENLTNAAKEVLKKPQSSGTEDSPAKHSQAAEYIQNVAHIVLDKSNQAADSSKAYVENVVHKVQDYAENAASGTTGSTLNIQETFSKAGHPGSTTGIPGEGDASSGSDVGLLTSVATWCSSLCGSKNNAAGGELRSVDLQAAAENVAEVLHSSASTSTTSSSAETPQSRVVTPAEILPEAPASEPEKPTTSE